MLKYIKHIKDNENEYKDGMHAIAIDMAIEALEKETGHWWWVPYSNNPNIGNWHCSECRTIISHMPEKNNIPVYRWCPMCGRRMISMQESVNIN
jgi:hypothetical protein